ncbi:MAG: hypothetical protein CMH15_01100 [Mesonia sp.]|nr:hypothetical protein [Mesonia sp.]MAQ39646.1 hypothetical protein [Mesonia sp.]|tara:strand:+ start:62195 stop:63727 length:1533 start_codon:yes stop_codon:yes gene_type:complete
MFPQDCTKRFSFLLNRCGSLSGSEKDILEQNLLDFLNSLPQDGTIELSFIGLMSSDFESSDNYIGPAYLNSNNYSIFENYISNIYNTSDGPGSHYWNSGFQTLNDLYINDYPDIVVVVSHDNYFGPVPSNWAPNGGTQSAYNLLQSNIQNINNNSHLFFCLDLGDSAYLHETPPGSQYPGDEYYLEGGPNSTNYARWALEYYYNGIDVPNKAEELYVSDDLYNNDYWASLNYFTDLGDVLKKMYLISCIDCYPPQNLHVEPLENNSNSYSVIFSWSETNSPLSSEWEVVYGVEGFSPYTEGQSIITNDNPLLIEGLEGDQTYDFYVRSRCSANDVSLYTGPISINVCIPCPNCNSFKLEPNEKYVLNAWVKEGHAAQQTSYDNSSIELSYNGSSQIDVCTTSGKLIEGWQQVYGEFVVPANATNINISLINNNNDVACYFDDIRIHPYNSNLKSFVYDQKTQKLMAELDENNYATFYEYDNEGGLIRVKKETERGVYTIQETRSGTQKSE